MSKMKDFFKPDDFEEQFGRVEQAMANRELSAKIANAKLNKLIESWPEVYGVKEESELGWAFSEAKGYKVSHTARLAFIEEITKECDHEAELFVNQGGTIVNIPHTYKPEVSTPYSLKAKCKHCGVELQMTWSEKK